MIQSKITATSGATPSIANIPLPVLGISSGGRVILFTSIENEFNAKGVVLAQGDGSFKVGYNGLWTTKLYKPFEGEVTISNK